MRRRGVIIGGLAALLLAPGPAYAQQPPARIPRVRRSGARCRRSRAAACRPPALEHAKCVDHAACRDLRHALSREMGGDTDRELPPLCRRTTITQPCRQGKVVLTELTNIRD